MPDLHLLSAMNSFILFARAETQPLYSLRQQLNLAEHCQAKLQVHQQAFMHDPGCPHDTTFLLGIQEQAQNHESSCTALAAAQEEAKLAEAVRQQATSAQQELESLRGPHEAVLSELAVAKGRLSAFDESCQHSLDRVQTLSAALQEAHQAKVFPSCVFSTLSATLWLMKLDMTAFQAVSAMLSAGSCSVASVPGSSEVKVSCSTLAQQTFCAE